MAKDAQFLIMLEPSEKEEFEDFVEHHPDAENLSHFFRLSARKEKRRLENEDDEPVNAEVDLSEVTDNQHQILAAISDVIEQLDGIDVQTSEDPEVRECAAKFVGHLPERPAREIRHKDPTGDDYGDIHHRVETAGRFTDLFTLLNEEYGYDEYLIEKAARKAEKEIEDVHSIVVDGKRRYYFWPEENEEGGSE